MSQPVVTDENRWGAILHYPEPAILEIRWYDSTAEMSGNDFNEFLTLFANRLPETGARLCLVDANQFRMDLSKMSMGWRDENIIPRYNRAGVRKFAFHMPEGMPAIGSEPANEGPAAFPTGYFGSREAALHWLTQ